MVEAHTRAIWSFAFTVFAFAFFGGKRVLIQGLGRNGDVSIHLVHEIRHLEFRLLHEIHCLHTRALRNLLKNLGRRRAQVRLCLF